MGVQTKDLDFAISIMLESFIQSQKHAVAEEMRKKFRQYIAQATPLSDQFMRLLEKLFRDKAEDLRLQGVDVDATDIPVLMTDVVNSIERHDLDISQAQDFMRSEGFRQNFR